MTKLILGTAQLGSAYGINNQVGKLTENQCFEMLDSAWDCGIRELDTAEDYGESEEVIGRYHSFHSDRRFRICTKLKPSFDFSADDLDGHIKNTISKLRVDNIYVYYLHRFEMCRKQELLENLQDVKSSGLIENLGISVYDPQELDYILAELPELIDVVQIPFNILDFSRWSDSLKNAWNCKMDIYARSIYLQGMIFKDPNDAVSISLGLENALRCINEIAGEHNVDVSRISCDFVKDVKEVSSIILGSETTCQVVQNANLMSEPSVLSAEDIERMKKASSSLDPNATDPRVWPSILND